MLTQEELDEEISTELQHGLRVKDVTLSNVRDWGKTFEDVTQEQINNFLSQIGETRCHSCGSDEFALQGGICVDCLGDDFDDAGYEYWNGYEDCRR